MNRRSFVQFCVGAAAAGATGATVYSVVRPLAINRPPSLPPVTYLGAERIGGPAPRGVPFIPIFLNDNGVFEGRPTVPTQDGSGEENVLEWYRYCARGGAPGLSLDYADDQNELKFFISEEKVALITPWYEDKLGDRIRPDDFPDVEFGAGFSWRSEGQGGTSVLTGAIIRYPPGEMKHQLANVTPPANPIDEARYEWFLREFTHEGEDGSRYVAVSTLCTHFCCVPGYRENRSIEEPRGAWGKLFCTCHNSIYEPRQPVDYIFNPERAEDAESSDSPAGGGGGGDGGGH